MNSDLLLLGTAIICIVTSTIRMRQLRRDGVPFLVPLRRPVPQPRGEKNRVYATETERIIDMFNDSWGIVE